MKKLKKLILLGSFYFFVILITGSFKLPDSDQLTCYDDKGNEITCPKIDEYYYGQDANYLINPPKYTQKEINGEKIIIDENTGLIWMEKTADINKDGKISKFDTVSQQGDPSDVLTWQEAVDYCNNLNYAGYDDWRLPTLLELSTIVNYGIAYPSIDISVFESQLSYYWTNTLYVSKPDGAWNIYFGNGKDSWGNKSRYYFVRCVRGVPIDNLVIDRFENLRINGNEIVKDKLTGLLWQKADDGKPRTWKDALRYCENLTLAGYSDWRLPNIQELRSIVKYDVYKPAIDTKIFECKSFYYWTSTTYFANYPDAAWVLDFFRGSDYWEYKSGLSYVRCVRGGVLSELNKCNSIHLEYCKKENDCKNARGYWYDNKCVYKSLNAQPFVALNAVNIDLKINPSDYIIFTIPSKNVYLQPSLIVTPKDIGKRAKIVMYIVLKDNFELTKNYILYGEEKTLNDVIKFDIIKNPINLKNFEGLTFDVYYGYIMDNGEIKYNAYRVKVATP